MHQARNQELELKQAIIQIIAPHTRQLLNVDKKVDTRLSSDDKLAAGMMLAVAKKHVFAVLCVQHAFDSPLHTYTHPAFHIPSLIYLGRPDRR